MNKNHHMPHSRLILPVPCLFAWSLVFLGGLRASEMEDFMNPPREFQPKPLWFWNNTTVTASTVADQMRQAKQRDGYGGFGILPFGGNFKPSYLSEEYFSVYGEAVRVSKELGTTLCLYDEYGFPSGSAGAINGDGVPRFANAYPDDTIKRLDKHEEIVTGPLLYQKDLPAGKLMACVAMESRSGKRIDLSKDGIEGGRIRWKVPEGDWRVMSFVCVKDGDPNVDYLNYDACRKFVGMTHQKYFDHFGKDFGPRKTIDGVFFDETTMYRAKGRIWTGNFNEKFEALHRFSPALLYPALWHDIGPDTQAARNFMFGMRAELYASGFAKCVQDWCREHGGISATGHQDQEEIINPCNVSGDLMKCFKHQDIPGIDKIGGPRGTEAFYKVVSSSANNYDKPLVMSETYGALGNIGVGQLYQIAMDQYAKGINLLIPHAVWYDPGNVTFLPELSWRNPIYNKELPEFNRYLGRLNLMLQNNARHVADIAVLYPIATLQGSNHLDGPLGFYAGGVAVPEADYADIGTDLSDQICRDFTFLHPEVLDETCKVNGSSLWLNNPVNRERFTVFIMPGHHTIQWSNLRKIKSFYDAGGKVIATRRLPSKSAEFGHDADVVRTIHEMFGEVPVPPTVSASTCWSAGGFDAVNVNDLSEETRWNAADGARQEQWLEIDFHGERSVRRTVVSEAFGRINSYEIQYWNQGKWNTCAKGTSIGELHKDVFPEVRTSKLRLFIHSVTSDSPSIREFGVYDRDGVNLAIASATPPRINAKGGRTRFLPNATAASLRMELDEAQRVYDVEWESEASVRCIHKVQGNRHVYFFANPGKSPVRTYARLRGRHAPQLWNPHTGKMETPRFELVRDGETEVTRVLIELGGERSVFVTSGSPDSRRE